MDESHLQTDRPVLFTRRHFLALSAAGAAMSFARPVLGQAPATHPVTKPAPELLTFDDRRHWLLERIAANPKEFSKWPFFSVSALFQLGRSDEAIARARRAYADLPKMRVRQVAMFDIWTALDCFIRHRKELAPECEAPLRDLITHTDYYKDTRTSNLMTLARVIRFLGNETWGADAFVPQAAFKKEDPDARKSLMKQLDLWAHSGFGEYMSWPYFQFNIMPVNSLAELAQDVELRNRAQIAFETGLARNASFWLDGIWGCATGRSYPDVLTDSPWGSASMMWMYFGGNVTAVPSHGMLAAAVMNYTPHPLITAAATMREQPHTAVARFWTPRQISYVNRTYVLFSEMQAEDKPTNFHQSYPYGVMFRQPDTSKPNFLWLTVPLYDSPDTISASHPHGTHGTRQSNLQHEDTLLYVCDMTRVQNKIDYALCYVPSGLLASINESAESSRVFLHYPGVLIAITSSAPFQWDPSAPLQASVSHRKDDSEFRIHGKQFAVAMETASPLDYANHETPAARLRAFRNAVVAKSQITCDPAGPIGMYWNRRGTVLIRKFNHEATIDGKPVDFANWPALQSPWMSQPAKGNLQLKAGTQSRTYDFDHWTVTDQSGP